MTQIRVLKLNLDGEITWQYDGHVLQHRSNAITLEAFFNRPDMPFLDLELKKGDRFVETFYADRWYNLFEIYDRDDKKLKGWYCNISRPAAIQPKTVAYVDLALDLWVSPEGSQTVLDEDEFEVLQLEPGERQQALLALRQLQKDFEIERPPL